MAFCSRTLYAPQKQALGAVLSAPSYDELREGASGVMDTAIGSLLGQRAAIYSKGGLAAAPAADLKVYAGALELTVLFLRDMVNSAPNGTLIVRFPKAIWDDIITIGGDRMVPGFNHDAVADALIEMKNAQALCVGVDGESYTSPDAWCNRNWLDVLAPEPTYFHYVYRAASYAFWVITDAIQARIGAFIGAMAALGVLIASKIKFKASDLFAAYKDYLVIAAIVLGVGATLYFLPQIKAALSPLTYKP